jgi:hypothetical protein
VRVVFVAVPLAVSLARSCLARSCFARGSKAASADKPFKFEIPANDPVPINLEADGDVKVYDDSGKEVAHATFVAKVTAKEPVLLRGERVEGVVFASEDSLDSM